MRTLNVIVGKGNNNGMMYVAKQVGGDIYRIEGNALTRLLPPKIPDLSKYERVITYLYPAHIIGEKAQKQGKKWVVYDMELPPPRLFRGLKRIYYEFLWGRLLRSMLICDEIWTFKSHPPKNRLKKKPYCLFVGRSVEYKNVELLRHFCKLAGIQFVHAKNVSDAELFALYKGAAVYATASKWEGFDMPVMEAQALGVPVVCYAGIGNHDEYVKKGTLAKDDTEFIEALAKFA